MDADVRQCEIYIPVNTLTTISYALRPILEFPLSSLAIRSHSFHGYFFTIDSIFSLEARGIFLSTASSTAATEQKKSSNFLLYFFSFVRRLDTGKKTFELHEFLASSSSQRKAVSNRSDRKTSRANPCA